MKKLIQIQSELKAPKNQRNNFGKYNYRSCEDILEAVKPLLIKHNCTLTITDEIKEVGSLVFVESIAHFVDSDLDIDSINCISVKAQAGINPDRKGMDIAQSFGSSSSYARKYALNGLFLIDDTKDADATTEHNTVVEKKAFTLADIDRAITSGKQKEALALIEKGDYTADKSLIEKLKK